MFSEGKEEEEPLLILGIIFLFEFDGLSFILTLMTGSRKLVKKILLTVIDYGRF